MSPLVAVALLVAAFAAGILVDQVIRRVMTARRRREAEDEAERIRQDAEREVEAHRKEIELEGRERTARAEQEVAANLKRRRREIEAQRRDLDQKLRNLNRRHELVESKQADVDRRGAELDARRQEVDETGKQAEALRDQHQSRLEQIARMTAEQARNELTSQIRADARRESSSYLRKVQEETREESDREAQRLMIESLQRFSSAQVVDPTTTVVQLPNEEMKGRIIGREGRNIRSLEMATGIDLLVDDTPQAILLSCFDPVRREIARLSIEKLIEDGRIHPARVEEVVEKTRHEFDLHVMQEGETAAFELGIAEVHARLVRLVGRMGYCHSGGHNLLQHTREVVLLSTNMAAQVNADSEVVRRAAFLHEIGAVDDSDTEVHPVQRSVDLATKFNEPEAVTRAIRSLHPEEQDKTVEGILVQIGHDISTNRPGARKENLEIFTKRMDNMEAIACSFDGVHGAFAIKAGKELRVVVNTESITDADAIWLARDIGRRIQDEVSYPGQIRVSVVRETRTVDYAM